MPKKIDLSPEDKAIVEQEATSALRFAYHGTVDEPLPARMLLLLKQLSAESGEDFDTERHDECEPT
jgi:hypothetical protein